MGDRANVAVVQDSGHALVYLYSHWGGDGLPKDVQKALAKRWRWTDGPYLTRIIFDVMTEDCHGEETSFGISTSRCDNEHSIIVVNPVRQIVGFAREDAEPDCYVQWSFEQYLKLSEDEIEQAYYRSAV